MIEIGSITSWVVFIACITGQSARTLIPYFNKINTGEITQFDLKFLYTVTIAFVGALTPSMVFFPVVLDQIPEQYSAMGLPFVFVFVAIAAYGANDIVNYGLKQIQKKVGESKTEKVQETGAPIVDIDALADKIVEKQAQARKGTYEATP